MDNLKISKPEELQENRFKNSVNTHILVTGGLGFSGSHFINLMFKKYSNILIYNIDAMYYCADICNVNEEVRSSDRYTFIKGNICSTDLISHILSHYKINFIVHFAAQSHV